ncbi:DNA-binding GntR family transcriptional regulator [Curtobacterium sp. PhB130]|uniref:GntR family transcriptional regulator n=1 Tax=unclassified Curtobacterium TaxID=257496 RepID=UPI000FB0EFE8|nr:MULTISPECIES: GntR family transcriptional regulator [unclassified Curtobacterium]ROS72244.1 DNA-binding GntR family transcriptional regulator [Curtobacterium sp. PhB130]TCK63053.1 DNA-binding GntR family transcriptional regulator [Curtobacterium sp. PhB136]
MNSSTTSAQAASDRAYDHVKRAIIRGDLPGGTAISENALCQDLGVSRTPVHEAFLRLAAEELLTLESRKGAVVRPMSPNEAADVLEMREAIESTAASRVVTDGRVTDLAPSLQAMLAEQATAVADGDVDRFIEVDAEFHGAVIGASRNAIAVLFARTLRDRQQRLRHQLMRVQPSQLQSSLDDHRALAAALEDGDAARYAAVLHDHVASHRGAL